LTSEHIKLYLKLCCPTTTEFNTFYTYTRIHTLCREL